MADTIDTDLDGLTDATERAMGSNPYVRDTDNDGLSDYAEWRLGTKPNDDDSDGDGVRDGAEVAQRRDPVHADPLAAQWARANRPGRPRRTTSTPTG